MTHAVTQSLLPLLRGVEIIASISFKVLELPYTYLTLESASGQHIA